jgi:hypothetical protein
MADLSTRSIKEAPTGAEIARGNISAGDARTIRMIVTVGERRVGALYVVDSCLAQHYCEVLKMAEYVKDPPEPKAEPEKPVKKEPGPGAVQDRMMRPPPRGRRG